jgi:hypothetical protein
MALADTAGNIYNFFARPRLAISPAPAPTGGSVAVGLVTFTAFAPATYTSNDIAVDPFTELALDFDVTTLASGTAQLLVDRKSASGGYFPICTCVAITGVATQSATIGAGYVQSAALGSATGLSAFSASQAFGDIIRVRVIVVTGTMTGTLSIKAK